MRQEKYYVVPDKDELLSAIQAVLSELESYAGESITAHVHPLHDAVVKLESRCRICRSGEDEDGLTVLRKIPQPLDSCWFYMLWASRGRRLVRPGERSAETIRPKTPCPDKQLAMYWRGKLISGLSTMEQLVVDGSYHRALTEFPDEPEDTDDYDMSPTERREASEMYKSLMRKRQLRDLMDEAMGWDWLHNGKAV